MSPHVPPLRRAPNDLPHRRRRRAPAADRLPHLPGQAARRGPGRVHPPPHQGPRRSGPRGRGPERPALPRARLERCRWSSCPASTSTTTTSRCACPCRGRSRAWATPSRSPPSWAASFPEPLAFSIRAYQHLRPRVNDFDLVQDNQSLGYGLLGMRTGRAARPRHHPPPHHRRSPPRDGARRDRLEAVLQGPLVRVHQDADPGRFADAPGHHRVAELARPTSAPTTGSPLDRLHVVPVGVDQNLFRPLPDVERIPGRLITTASADVTMKGLRYLLEAVAKLRTERPRRAGGHRTPEGGRAGRPHHRRARPARRRHLRHRRPRATHHRALLRGRGGRRALALRGLLAARPSRP